MKNTCMIGLFVLYAVSSFGSPPPRSKPGLGDNAALRYYAAFAEMRDSSLTNENAKELNEILDGSIPYDDAKFHALVEKNKSALQLMARGTELAHCDWGLDYGLGEDTPVDYARNALALGRLNVLYTFHLQIAHEEDGVAHALAAGLRFSHDVASGGSLFAALVAKDLLAQHLGAVRFVMHREEYHPAPSVAQMAAVKKAIESLGTDGVDWRAAAALDLGVLRTHFEKDPQASDAVTRISSSYLSAIHEPSQLPALQKQIGDAPKQVSQLIPNPARVIEEKNDLLEKIRETRILLQ
jgi:hypothetical protein